MWQYNYTDELYHYGVPGMKWGVRKASYRSAKKQYREASREASRTGFGIKGIQKGEAARRKARNAYTNMIVERANYKKSGSKNPDKAEFKSYVKSMNKSGLPGSAADKKGHSKAIYNRLKRDKGKEYADKVIKKVENQAISRIIGSTIAVAGAVAVSAIINSRVHSDHPSVHR